MSQVDASRLLKAGILVSFLSLSSVFMLMGGQSFKQPPASLRATGGAALCNLEKLHGHPYMAGIPARHILEICFFFVLLLTN